MLLAFAIAFTFLALLALNLYEDNEELRNQLELHRTEYTVVNWEDVDWGDRIDPEIARGLLGDLDE